ncbi:hypothetical protein ACFPH6_11765 [Streptomyces xiangluensis]|uniref:Uncharacterized protein n=1 Tax=Streptomyces xiangluensis TaxID=2665720 RepID=A0ABV8YN14_9ACTN
MGFSLRYLFTGARVHVFAAVDLFTAVTGLGQFAAVTGLGQFAAVTVIRRWASIRPPR